MGCVADDAPRPSASRRTASRSSSPGRVHGIRTNRSSPPSAANTGPGATITPRRSASLDQRPCRTRRGSSAPQREPAGRPVEAPLGQLLARPRRPGRRAARAAARRLAARISSASASSRDQHQLLEHGRAEVEADPGPGEPLHLAARRPDPAQPQPTPERLAGAPDRDRVGGVRRERSRHLLALERQRLVGLVDDRDGVRRDAGARRTPRAARRSSGGRSGSGSRGSGTPASARVWRSAAPTASRSQPSGSTGDRRQPGAAVRAARRWRWGRPATRPATRSPGPVKACATIDAADSAPASP